MKIGRVISSELATNRDGEGKVLMLQVEIAEADDIQAVELFRQPGDECRPNEDATVLIADLGDAWRVAVAADDGIEPEAEAGERGIYASDAGVKKSQVMCRKDGTVEAGLTGFDFVAMAAKVLDELNKIKIDLDAVKTAFDAHTHILAIAALAGAGGTGTAAPPATPITAPHTPASVASANLKAETP
jgi:hypothetical protein